MRVVPRGRFPPEADQPLAEAQLARRLVVGHFVYILESVRNGKRYVGLTSKPVSERLREHNAGSNRWTKANRPCKLLKLEEFTTRSEAAAREKFLKSGVGRRIRDGLIRGQSVGD